MVGDLSKPFRLPDAIPNSPRETGESHSRSNKNVQVASMVVGATEMVVLRGSEEVYIREEGTSLYRPLDEDDLREMVWRTWFSSYGSFLPSDIDAAVRTVKMLIPRRISNMSRRVIQISNNLFWDRETGMVSNAPSEPVFFRLFDTKYETKHVVKIPEWGEKEEQIFMDTYNQVLEEINNGVEVERFEPLKVWANGSHDVYMDLHRAHAYMFLKKQPMGAYILIGVARNGKSAYCGMTHSILGEQNTSTVPLTEMGDWHLNMDLAHTLMNSPDEEEDKVLTSQSIFKTVADHGVVKLKVMREQKPIDVNCDFMCFFPMNHTPKWEGSGATACMKRSLVIPFTADLSRMDFSNSNFAKETFTAEFMAEYMGSVFAYANYYHRHPLVFSDTMRAEQSTLEEEEVNYKIYIERFMVYFKGYTRLGLVYQDYINWCRAKSFKFAPQKAFKFYLNSKFPPSSKVTARIDGEPRSARIIEGTETHRIFHEGLKDMEIEPLETLHTKQASVVDQLDEYWSAKKWEAKNGFSRRDLRSNPS